MLGFLFCAVEPGLYIKLEKRILVVLCFDPTDSRVLDSCDALLATFF